MKIAIIVPSLRKTAPVNIAIDIFYALKKNDFNVTLYYLDSLSGLKNNEANQIQGAIQLNRNIKSNLSNYDIIHSHGLRPDIINFLFAKKKIRLSTIHSILEQDLKSRYGFKGYIISKLWMLLLRKYSQVISISHHVKKYLEINKIPSTCIYNGANTNRNHNAITTDICYQDLKKKIHNEFPGKIIIGTISHLEKVKGIEQILYVVSYNTNYVAVIVGSGSELNHLIDLANQLNIQDRVIFTGHINENANFYSSLFHVYIQPSHSEGFGLSVIEAIINKTPVICSNIDTFKELFPENTVLFFDKNNIESLDKAIHLSIKHANINEAYSLVSTHYSTEVMTSKYIDLYRKYE